MTLIPTPKVKDAWDEVKDRLKHEILPDLQGGKDGEHYHLTQEQLAKLESTDKAIEDAVKGVKHEALPDLLGGSASGHYHVTEAELTKLKNTPETISIGTVTTGAAGSQASVTKTGTATNAILNFVIPRGDNGEKGEKGNPFTYSDFTAEQLAGLKGAKGDKGNKGDKGDAGAAGAKGADGKAATVKVGTVTTGAAGSSVSITNSGTASDAVLNFTIPRGANGANGTNGKDGTTPTISIGTVTTGAAGSSASVTKSGTASNVVLNFTIPRGDTGAGANVTIVNNLTLTATGSALSANQGHVLKGLIDDINASKVTVYNGLDKTAYQATVALSAYQGAVLKKQIDEIKASKVEVYDNVNGSSAAYKSKALSAYQGYLLSQKLSQLSAQISDSPTNTETWTFTLTNGTTVTKKVVLG